MDFVECPAPVAVVVDAVSAPEDDNEGGSCGGGGGNGGATGRVGATGIDAGVAAKDNNPDDDDGDDDVVRRELAVPPAIETVPSGLVNLFAAEDVLLPLLLLALLLL